MGTPGNVRRASITGALFLIVIGVFFLVLNLRPDVDLWTIVFRYWPLILIFIGIGKIFDAILERRDPQHGGETWFSGVTIAFLVLILLFGLAVWRGHSIKYAEMHSTKALELQGAKTVSATIEMPAGTLDLSGGSPRLLDADFDYNRGTGTPSADYSVSGTEGLLNIREEERSHFHIRTEHDIWGLRFGNDVPLDLKINMGAGQSNLRLNGMNVTHLELNMGAGQLDADFTGSRKSDLVASIEGGVGSATIRLPKDVGVQVRASGGIGSISTDGLRGDGDTYVNEAYGKSSHSIQLTVKGGIGEITLIEEH
jgi:hypothetical protein